MLSCGQHALHLSARTLVISNRRNYVDISADIEWAPKATRVNTEQTSVEKACAVLTRVAVETHPLRIIVTFKITGTNINLHVVPMFCSLQFTEEAPAAIQYSNFISSVASHFGNIWLRL